MFVDEQLPHDVTRSVKARHSPGPRSPREEPPPRASRAAERRPVREEPLDGTDTGLEAHEGGSAQMSLAVGVLTCVKGHEQGLALPLLEGAYTVGRGRENSFVLKDIAASRQHLRLEVIGRRVRVTDLGSGNGTRLNGTALREAYLDTGDLLEIGNSALRFERATHRSSEAGLPPSTAPKARPATSTRELSPEALWADDEPHQRLSDVIPEDAPLRSVAALREADALAKTAARASPGHALQANGAKGPPAGEESLLAPMATPSSMEDVVPPRVPPLPAPAASSRPQGPQGTSGEARRALLPRGLWLVLLPGSLALLVGLIAVWAFSGASAPPADPPRDDAALARAQVELALAAEAIEAGLPDVALRHAERAASLDRANPAAVALEASLRAQLKVRTDGDTARPEEPAVEGQEPPPAAVPPPAEPAGPTEPAPSATEAIAAPPTAPVNAAAAVAEPLPLGEEPGASVPTAPAVEPPAVQAPVRKSPPRKRRSSSSKKRRERKAMSDSEAGDLYRKAVRLVRDDDEKQGCALMSRIAKEAPEGSNWRVKAAAGVDRYGCR